MDPPPSKIMVNPYLKKRRRPDTDSLKTEPSSSIASIAPSPSSLAKITPQPSELAATSPAAAANVAETFSSPSLSISTANPPAAENDAISANASALIISAADKAGMDGIDRSKIDAIILRESGNSHFMQQQRRRDEKVNLRIQKLKQKLDEASPKDYQITDALDNLLEGYRRQSPTRSTCVVVDMDMFYMAAELLRRPHLKDKPACVGRGMILTSNYVARRYGVRSAMPGFIGDKLVEELSGGKEKLTHVSSNFDLYKEKSKIVKDTLKEYDPFNMKSYSLDEAYLDIGPYLAVYMEHKGWDHEQIRDYLLQDNFYNQKTNPAAAAMEFLQSRSSMECVEVAREVVDQLRRRVQERTGGLTCSAGVAPNFSLAKIASDKNKPNGQLLVDPNHVLEFVHALPIRKIPGIGRVTEKLLQQVCQVHTVKDLYEQRGLVQYLFKPATAEFLLKATVGCNGSSGITSSDFGMEDEETTHSSAAVSSFSSSEHQKGISRERTFSSESDWAQLNIRLEDIAQLLANDMAKISVMAHTVTVKVKLASFDMMSRAQSLKRGVYIQNREELMAVASQLLVQIRAQYKKEHSKGGNSSSARFSVRLLGIRCSNLIEESSFHASQQGTMDKFLGNPSSVSGAPSKDPGLHNSAAGDLKGNARCDGSSPRKQNGTDNDRPFSSPDTHVKPPPSAREAPKEELCGEKNERVKCPLCPRFFPAEDNAALNAHIDTCLSSSTVRQAIQEEDLKQKKQSPSQIPTSTSNKRARLTDFWH